MNACVVFVAVSLWGLLLQVDAKFYLESSDTERNTYWFLNPTVEYEKRIWDLHECDSKKSELGVNLDVKCTKVADPKKREKIYAVANFYSVRDLTLSYGSRMKLNGRAHVNETLPQVGWVGVEPRDFHKPTIFVPLCEDEEYFLERVASINRFVNMGDTVAFEQLLQFFSINNIGLFFTFTAQPAAFFETFEVVLQKVIDASGYSVEKDFWEIFLPKINLAANHLTQFRSQSISRLQSFARFLPRFGSRSQSQSQLQSRSTSYSQTSHPSPTKPGSQSPPYPRTPHPSPTKPQPQCITQSQSPPHSHTPPPSPTKPQSPPYPRTPHPSPTKPQSPPKFPPYPWTPHLSPNKPQSQSPPYSQTPSPSPTKPQSQYPPQSQSPPRAPTRTLSRTSKRYKLPELKIDLFKAIVFLPTKMFDPCLVLQTGHGEKALAQSVCTTYCRFLSMVGKVYEPYSKHCKHLKTGICDNKMCICVPRCGVVPAKNVNMVFCHNALRSHLHEAEIREKYGVKNSAPEK